MSLTATFVQAEDCKYYRNLILYSDDWFLCFDDDDPPELVVKAYKHTTANSAEKRAKKILKDCRIEGHLAGSSGKSSRCFDRSGKLAFHEAYSFWVSIKAPLPLPNEGDSFALHADATMDSPGGECTIYEWAYDFDVRQLYDYYTGQGQYPRLVRFLAGRSIERQEDWLKIKKELETVMPEIKTYEPDQLVELYGERIKIKR